MNIAKDYCYYLNGTPVIVAPGQTSITGGDVTVGKIAPAPVITKQPADVEVKLGERFRVSPEVQGNGLTYQWYYKDSYMKNFAVSSNKTSAYAYAMQSYMHNRQVYCVITDQYGQTVTTEVATITRPPMELKILAQPEDACNPIGQKFSIKAQVQGEGLKYQWYLRNAGSKSFSKSGVKDNTYDDEMTKARANREIYCIITDQWGNSVTTDMVKLIAEPNVELKLLSQTYESASIGDRYCVTVEAQGEGLKYQWYFSNAGSTKWYKSSVRDNTYDDVMNKTRMNRDVYCVITDQYGNQVATDVVTLYDNK